MRRVVGHKAERNTEPADTAVRASFHEPRGIAVGNDLSIYVVDYGSHLFREID